MSNIWADMSNKMFPYSSSDQNIYIQEIMQIQIIRKIIRVCIIRPLQENNKGKKTKKCLGEDGRRKSEAGNLTHL